MRGMRMRAGSQSYLVNTEEQAKAFAEALAQHGFAYVTGEPAKGELWRVVAYDEGPYPFDLSGSRTLDAVFLEAAEIAERFGASWNGGDRGDSGYIMPHQLRTPILHENPGS